MMNKPITGFPGYLIDEDGNITIAKTGAKLKCQTKKTGYVETCLHDEDGAHYLLLHRLVAKEFCEGYEDGKEVNHIDGDKQNNRASNLEWVSHRDNLRHAYESGLRKDDVTPRRVRGTNIETGEQYDFPSIYVAARFLGISQGNICMCCKGQRPAASGYFWEYVEN